MSTRTRRLLSLKTREKVSDLKVRAGRVAVRRHTMWQGLWRPVSSAVMESICRPRRRSSVWDVGRMQQLEAAWGGKNNTEERCLLARSVRKRCPHQLAKFPSQTSSMACGCPLGSWPLKHTHSHVCLFSPPRKCSQSWKHSCFSLAKDFKKGSTLKESLYFSYDRAQGFA